MTCGLVHASCNLPEWQAVKLTFFAPYIANDTHKRTGPCFFHMGKLPLMRDSNCGTLTLNIQILVFWMGDVVPSYHGWSHQFEV